MIELMVIGDGLLPLLVLQRLQWIKGERGERGAFLCGRSPSTSPEFLPFFRPSPELLQGVFQGEALDLLKVVPTHGLHYTSGKKFSDWSCLAWLPPNIQSFLTKESVSKGWLKKIFRRQATQELGSNVLTIPNWSLAWIQGGLSRLEESIEIGQAESLLKKFEILNIEYQENHIDVLCQSEMGKHTIPVQTLLEIAPTDSIPKNDSKAGIYSYELECKKSFSNSLAVVSEDKKQIIVPFESKAYLLSPEPIMEAHQLSDFSLLDSQGKFCCWQNDPKSNLLQSSWQRKSSTANHYTFSTPSTLLNEVDLSAMLNPLSQFLEE